MALLASELIRLKFELGYNVLTIGAEPRIDYVAIFDQVIGPYMSAGATTTSSTAVTAASSPTLVTLTLGSVTGFTAGCVVIIDVDDRQERATVESVSGSTISLLLSKTHGGTYSVTVEGGETIIRSLLDQLRTLATSISESSESAGLKSVGRGAVEWYGNSSGSSGSVLGQLKSIQMHLRDQLASACGIPNMWRLRGGGASSLY